MKHRIWLSSPHMGGGEQRFVDNAFKSNWIAPTGPNIDAFENSVGNFVGIDHVAALNTGTAAIHLALIILGVEAGDEVIVSSFTFCGTVNPIIYQHATPVFVDSESETWNLCPDLLEKAIKDRLNKGKKPKVIMPVHLYGMPANMSQIMEIASRYDIPVIEDAAESLGSRFEDRSVGTFGTIGTFSFNGNKIITTSGGGALISNDKKIVEKARFLATQARDKAPHYQHSHIGYNYRMSNISAGIGRGQMEVIEQRIKQRRENFHYYKKNLGYIDGVKFTEEPNEKYFSNHWLTTILIDSCITGINREEIKHALDKEDIETRPLWKPMHLQPVYSEYPAYLNGYSEELFNRGLCLPSGSNMTDDDRERVVNSLLECLKKS